MPRLVAFRAAVWLALLAMASQCFMPFYNVAFAQTVVAPAPMAQPMWVGAPPAIGVGPNGAINLDQPILRWELDE